MKNNNYTVYMHICPNNKKYIGITKQNPKYRWGRGSGYCQNKHFYNAIKKYGWNNIKHEILFTNLCKRQAEKKEKELIAYYKSNLQKYGYNILEGGNASDGLTQEIIMKNASKKRGVPLTEEHKLKIKNSLIGQKRTKKTCQKISKALTGKKLSKETKEKISISKKGTQPWNKGKTNIYSEKQIEHFRKKAKELWKNKKIKDIFCKKVKCIELNMTFNSITEASNYFNMNNTSHISDCCKNKTKSCGKYNGEKLHWEYVK